MQLRFQKRDTFYISGYCIETSLEQCGNDISVLWDKFVSHKQELFALYGEREDYYGLMWYTEDHRYCYLIGIETDNTEATIKDVICRCVEGTDYAVAHVPSDMSAVDAWTQYYEKNMPEAGFKPDLEHGMNFEYYPGSNSQFYELWTPVKQIRK